MRKSYEMREDEWGDGRDPKERGGWAHISGGDQLGEIRGTNGTRKAGVHTLHGRQSMICPL